MITLTSALPEEFCEDIAYVRTLSLFRCYHGVLPNVRFYLQKQGERVTAVMSVSDGVINLTALSNADHEELKAFVFSLGGRLFCEADTLERLELSLPFWCGEILTLKHPPQPTNGTTDTPDIKSLYLGLKQEFSIPPFEDFYADIFYRRRADAVHFCSVVQDSFTVSSAMTVAESNASAIIGGVFTRNEHRKKGYGSAVVNGLCSKLKTKNIYVLIREPELMDFYKKSGFEKTGIWTETEI